MITGEITYVQPAVIPPGQPLDIFVSFDAFNPGGRFWATRITAVISDGKSNSDKQSHPGEKGHRESEELSLGTMPNSTVKGTILLEAVSGFFELSWETLDYKSFTISPAISEVVIAPKPEPSIPYTPPYATLPVEDKAWWEIWKPDTVAASPSTPTFEFPFETQTPEQKTSTWLWAGLGIAGVLAVVLFWR